MVRRSKTKILKASFHRNGVSGEGFYAILFTCEDAEGPMFAALFDELGYCAVTEVAKLVEGNIEFANGNSWHGDVYEASLRPLLETYLKKQGINR